ncbi:AraC family transcriptional regulator [Salinarimonas soli]|uniref:AraC family transcriptional regulator n=1 Tax=Salinarimonas soli TaxID=1638099 RepID=A0A5B2VAR2_9HYPH|nr:AraC family transcriptional regulator [Salinarimonas soli]KAA2235808.1 AraC family transcriptional regulator [Salinarimonas soli]
MKKDATRLDYGRRMQRVAAHIARHLDEDLTLERLAGIACFSPYHFHRLYRAITGETTGETVRRLRLHRAANELAQSTLPIAGIARRAGYGSVEAFNRAFAADHRQPPAAFRARQLHETAHPTEGDTDMTQVTIKAFDGAAVAALPHRGDYQAIGGRFEELTAWAGANGLFQVPRRWFAIYYDDAAAVPQADLRSEACVEIEPGRPLGPGMEERRIPPGRVATIVHRGPYAELERVYRTLYGEWLPRSGEEPDDRPSFEEYLNNPREVPPAEWLTEVFLPLKGQVLPAGA